MSSVTNQNLPRRTQSGVVLPTALIALLAATILSLALVKTNMISLRIGGASVISQEAQAAAELLLSNFLTRNPLGTSPGYESAYTPCTAAGELPPADKMVFDCQQIDSSRLPKNTTANIPVIQRTGCGTGPRSSTPTMAGSKFNYYQVATEVTNDAYGSHAQVGMGVAKMVIECP